VELATEKEAGPESWAATVQCRLLALSVIFGSPSQNREFVNLGMNEKIRTPFVLREQKESG
jgi:hypothetical protein